MLARRITTVLALVTALAVLLAAPSARADCQDLPGTYSTSPVLIRVVGFSADGSLDPTGEFTVTLRDVAQNPLPDFQVKVDFTDCPGLELCGVTGANYARIDPTGHIVTAMTDAAGQVHLRIAGSLNLPIGAPEPANWRARVSACSILLSTPTVAVLDLTGRDGTNSGDFSYFVTDIGAHLFYARDDYDGNGVVNSADLSVLATLTGLHGSLHGCGNH